MKAYLIVLVTFFSLVLSSPTFAQKQKSIYDFVVKDIDGNNYDFSQLKGKKVLIVNTATNCGYANQFKELQQLYLKYGGADFEIIAFPSNNFLGQEPRTNPLIKRFCVDRYGVDYPLMEKISVRGKYVHPFYIYLTDKKLNGVTDRKIIWNFQKYLIDENGRIVDVLAPSHSPLSDDVISWIEED
ncbi:MAG: glutathione peroxidase [Bacteroidales bacterium]